MAVSAARMQSRARLGIVTQVKPYQKATSACPLLQGCHSGKTFSQTMSISTETIGSELSEQNNKWWLNQSTRNQTRQLETRVATGITTSRALM
eukprot:649018-Amphidinium_carterae.1